MSQLPDEIYVPLHSKYGTLDYVIAYLYDWAYEENGYKAEDMQEYIPTYRCEERIRDAKDAMIEKATQWLFATTYDYLNEKDQEKVAEFVKAMEEEYGTTRLQD